jgi:flagellar basal-body rod protein FlgG
MLYRAMYTAASGMQAYMFNLDTIANNLANAGTNGFKRSRTDFEDLYYQYYKLPGTQDSQGNYTPIGTAAGLGVRVAGTQIDFSQGALLETGRQLDMALVGDGFFQVRGNTQTFYTRRGEFTLNPNGDIVLASADKGRLLDPPINIPPDTVEIGISAEGIVTVIQAGSTVQNQVGQIQLARFINPEGLYQAGESLYAVTDASGQPLISNPGDQGLGLIRQGMLEISNVEPANELVDLIKTQRNVELNSQVIQASDQLLQLITNLRRY